MTNRSDRREGKPNHPLADFRSCRRLAPHARISSWPGALRSNKRSKIRMQSDVHQFTNIIAFVMRDRERDRDLHRREKAEVCLHLTEESRYGVVVSSHRLSTPVRNE